MSRIGRLIEQIDDVMIDGYDGLNEDELEDDPNAYLGETFASIDEGISDTALGVAIGAMIDAPRVKSMFSRIGIDLDDDAVTSEFLSSLMPAVKLFLMEKGVSVLNAAGARRAVKDLAASGL